MLFSPQAKVRLLDWETEVRDSVARWRAVAARWPNDARIRELIAELPRLSPDFTRWWTSHEVTEHRSRIRRFNIPNWVRRLCGSYR